MSERVVITGTGLVTPLGATTAETWDALLAGLFIESHSKAKCPVKVGTTRLFQLAERSACEAVQQAAWTSSDLSNDRTALVVGTSKGPVECWTPGPSSGIGMPFDQVSAERLSFGLASLADELAHAFGLGFGPRLTLSAACASSLHALIRATMMIRSGQVDRALVVAAESSLQPLFLASFYRLGVFPPAGVGCRPFDEGRAGFLMSEASAAVCLDRANATNTNVEIDRFAIGGDATHLTAGDPGAQTLRHLLARCVRGRQIDMVHAHGTGTPTNDATELSAIESVVGVGQETDPPVVYSHKGALGHSLGAAGLVSVVLNTRMHACGIVPPNVRTLRPIKTSLTLTCDQQRRAVRTSLVTAAGFGGATAVVTLHSK